MFVCYTPLSGLQESAVEPDDLSGHVGGCVEGVPDHPGCFFGGGEVAGRDLICEGASFFGIEHPVHVGVNDAESDGVDLDIAWSEFFGEGLGQSLDAGFGCGVGCFAGCAASSPHGGDVEYFSGFFGHHMRDGFPAAVKGGGEVGGDQAAPLLIGHVAQKADVGNACIVDQDVESSVCMFGTGNRCEDFTDLVRVADIPRAEFAGAAWNRENFPADFLQCFYMMCAV